MQIDKNKTEVENIIAQLNDDLTRLGLTIRAPESGVTVEDLTMIPDAVDSGNDELLVRNTSVKVKFSTEEKEHETSFKYRRLSLNHILAKKALSNENGHQGTALKHNGTEAKDNAQETKNLFNTLLDVSLEKDHILEKTHYDPVKGITSYTLKAALNSFLYIGQTSLTVLTRAEDTGEYTENSNTHYFNGSSTLSGIHAQNLYLPKNMTVVPANFITDSVIENFSFSTDITQIGDRSFANSITSLTGINLPATLTHIGENAFQGANTDSFDIPDQLVSIGAGALGSVTTLRANKLSLIAQAGKSRIGGESSKYVLIPTDASGKEDTENNTHGVLTYLNGSKLYFTVETFTTERDIFKDKGFTTGLTALVLPKNMTDITDTFHGLTNFEEISLKEVTNLGANAFKDSTITTVKLWPTLTEIDSTAFTGATIVSFEVEDANHRDSIKQKLPNFASAQFILRQQEEGPVESELPTTVESSGFTYG